MLPAAPADPRSGIIPAYPRSARKRHHRPVTPEVAGSSPVAPVKALQSTCFLAGLGANDRRPRVFPAHIPPGNPRKKPAGAANSRKPIVPADKPEVAVWADTKRPVCRDFRLDRQRASLPSREHPAGEARSSRSDCCHRPATGREPVTRERDGRVRRARARGRSGRWGRRGLGACARPAVRVAGAAPRRPPRASRQGGATPR
jgi:hypothetical protein